jgi:sacsin
VAAVGRRRPHLVHWCLLVDQVNGYFELSSNRRDIWHGGDMQGKGRIRSNWNTSLLSDVIAPSYARLLLEAAKVLPSPWSYLKLWPVTIPADPWSIVVRR